VTYTVSGTISNRGGPGTASFQWVHDEIPEAPTSMAMGGATTVTVTDPQRVSISAGQTVQVFLNLLNASGTSQLFVTLTCQQIG
jgi:hypothetical protein